MSIVTFWSLILFFSLVDYSLNFGIFVALVPNTEIDKGFLKFSKDNRVPDATETIVTEIVM